MMLNGLRNGAVKKGFRGFRRRQPAQSLLQPDLAGEQYATGRALVCMAIEGGVFLRIQ
jgi:hypothetical protein